jgi:hypothetical protein
LKDQNPVHDHSLSKNRFKLRVNFRWFLSNWESLGFANLLS